MAKFSELNTEKGAEALLYLFPLINKLSSNEKIKKEIKSFISEFDNNCTRNQFAFKFIKAFTNLIPILIQEEKESIYKIISFMNGTKVKDIKKQNIMVTIKQIEEIINDKELLNFILSFFTKLGQK